MTFTPSMRTLNESFDMAAEELDYLLGRVCRTDPVLRLERESAKWWIVVDDRNDKVMLRAEYPTCVRFARAFLVKHPEATLDGSFGLVAKLGEPTAVEAGRPLPVPQAAGGEPASPTTSGEEHPPAVPAAVGASPDLFSVRVPLADVIPLRRA